MAGGAGKNEVNGGNGSENGGPGGNGQPGAGNGAGNPVGTGGDTGNKSGTGGLMVIYSNEFENNGSLESCGVIAGIAYSFGGFGGASGGGSINVFSKSIIEIGTTKVNGGKTYEEYEGSWGGTGTVNIGNISSGSYVSEYKNY